MKHYLFLLGLVLSSFGVVAQTATDSSNVKVEYVAKSGKVMPSAEGAEYRRETTANTLGGGVLRTFYLNGKPRSVAFYDDLARHTLHGVSEGWYENGQLQWRSGYEHGNSVAKHESFYENGQLKHRQHFVAGKREGELLLYYPNGALKRREMYVNNQRTTGVCYNVQSQEIPFFEYEVMPVFPGGQEALLRFISQNVHYPGKSLRRGVEGRVFVKFVVDSTGLVQQVEVVKGLDELINEEALRVVKKLPRFVPGRQDGRPVPVYYTVPLTFAINNRPLFKHWP